MQIEKMWLHITTITASFFFFPASWNTFLNEVALSSFFAPRILKGSSDFNL